MWSNADISFGVVKDADGNPSKVCKTTFIPTASQVDYILNTDPEYTYGMPQLSGKRVLTKYTLSVQEASEYFHIGYKKLRKLIDEHPDADFILWNGTRPQIKRRKFEAYIDENLSAI